MSGPVVHQFTAVLAGRDGVGFHTLALDDILSEMGAQTAIYAAHRHPEVRDRGRDFRDHPGDPPPDLVIYQASTGSPVADYLLSCDHPLILNYHNITPPEFFDPWEPHVGAELSHGRRQLAQLCRQAESGFADSRYNAEEVRALGLDEVEVATIITPAAAGGLAGSVGVGSGVPSSAVKTLLFVGRLAPNKCQQDLVAVLAVLVEMGVEAELVLVGGSSSAVFEGAVRGLVGELGLSGRVSVVGSVSDEELAGWYRRADVFVCVSEHEGFCVPLVEAMAWGVPVVAFGAAAVPETLGSAGVVLGDKSPVVVAGAVARVLSDVGVRERLVAAGLVRAAELGFEAAVGRWRELLGPVLADASQAPPR